MSNVPTLALSRRALGHPLTLASIGLLLLNDHVLKAAIREGWLSHGEAQIIRRACPGSGHCYSLRLAELRGIMVVVKRKRGIVLGDPERTSGQAPGVGRLHRLEKQRSPHRSSATDDGEGLNDAGHGLPPNELRNRDKG